MSNDKDILREFERTRDLAITDALNLETESPLPMVDKGSMKLLQQNIQKRIEIYQNVTDSSQVALKKPLDIAGMERLEKQTRSLLSALRMNGSEFRKYQQATVTRQFYQFVVTFTALLIIGLLMPVILIFILNKTLRSRSNTEARLTHASDEIQDLYQHAPCGYFSVTKDGMISDINNTLLHWLGYTRQQVINRLSVDQILAGGTMLFDKSMTYQMTKGNVADLELEMIPATKSRVPVIVNSNITTDKNGNYSSARCSVIDNTARKKAEQEIMRINKELEAFSYSVSHDLRAPLRSINGYAQILVEDFQDKLGDEGSQVLGTITKNASRMDQLINDLLQFSKVGREGVNKVPTKMSDIVTPILNELIAAENDRKIVTKINIKGIIAIDVNMFKQVWINLISNALKYSMKKSETIIEIGSQELENEMLYYIKDNGAGFDMAYADKLFGAFQRLHKTQDFQGTGVGLALAKRIIEKHDGTIWAESIPNEGATFYFKLPAKPSA